MNSKYKKFIDILLLMLFLSGLASMFLPTDLHEIFGYIFIILVVLHNIANKHFYRSQKKFINTACIVLFALSLVILAVSGFMLSNAWNVDYNWRSIHLGAAILALICLLGHLLIHARRYIKNKIFYAMSFVALLMAVGGIFGLPYLDRWFHKVEVNSAEIIHGGQISTNEKILTVYFSRVGNTDFPPDVDAVSGASVMRDDNKIFGNAQMIALMAQNAVGGDLLEIQTIKKYPVSYSETVNVAKSELNGNSPPDIKLIDLSSYDKIILVYPLWWSTLPKAVELFIKNQNLTGKTIIPIVTHGGGGIGNSLDILSHTTNANVIKDCLDIYSSDIPSARSTISDYLSKILN